MSILSRRICIIPLIVTLFMLCPFHVTNATGRALPTDLSGMNVALYYGDPSSSTSSRTALQFMFSWMNATVDILRASDVSGGDLVDYDMIVIPGGWAGTYNEDLAGRGITEIRNFIRSGGAFFGVCAGAYFGCDWIRWEGVPIEYPMNLYGGCGVGPVEEIAAWPGYTMTEIIIDRTSPLIGLSGEPANHTVMYYGGPWFEITTQEGIHSLATYSANNESAMIAFEYEDGRVFLSGPHPEWEEDSNRDGSSWENGFDDKGSEWNMMLSACLWLVGNHGTITETSSTSDDAVPLPVLLATSFLVIGAVGTALVLLYVVKYRRQ